MLSVDRNLSFVGEARVKATIRSGEGSDDIAFSSAPG